MSVKDTSFQQVARGRQVGNATAIDRRFQLTKEEMSGALQDDGKARDYLPRWKTTNTTTKETVIKKIMLPDPYFTVCEEDKQIYIYSKSNPCDKSEGGTGYFKKLAVSLAAGENGQILIFNSLTNNWEPSQFYDPAIFEHLTDLGLTIRGFAEAENNQVLAKDTNGNVTWATVATAAEIEAAKLAAQNAAAQALINAQRAKEYADFVMDMYWKGTLDEYKALPEIDPDKIYIILDGMLPSYDEEN